jgi:hypothetical protein
MSTQPIDGDVSIITVVIPESALPVENHAAAELSRYIGKMTGWKVPTVVEGSESATGNALIVGRTASNLKNHNPDDWPRDTIYIGYGSGDVAIIGQGSQGTLFAAYEFLRDQGCRWYVPDNVDEETVPKRKQLKLTGKPKKYTPSFYTRGWSLPIASPGTWRVHYYDWIARNQLNTPGAGNSDDFGAERGHGLKERGGHTLCALIDSGDFPKTRETFADHPEWYPLVNGKRVTEYTDARPVQACLSNPQVVQRIADQVIAYLKKHPEHWRFSVSPSDEPTFWCECEPCKATDGPDSQWQANQMLDAYGLRSPSGYGPMSRRYIHFINRVARIVGEACTDRFVSFYAYGSTVAPPEDDWTLESNIVVEYAYGDGLCLNHPITDASCKNNSAAHRWMTGWMNKGNPLLFYDYPPGGSNFDIPSGFTRSYQRLIRYSHEKGVTGWGGEGQGSWAGSGLWQYIKARLLWNVQENVDDLIDDFCRDMYGPAAALMKDYYYTFDDELQKLPGHFPWGGWANVVERETMNRLGNMLDKAQARADTKRYRSNVAMMQVAFKTLILARLEANIDTQSGSRKRYRRVRQEILDLLENYHIPITDRWRDRLAKLPYRVPFEAVNGTPLIDFPATWKFRTDPHDEGMEKQWHQSQQVPDANWQDISTEDYWTSQGITYHGVAWYTHRFTPPKASSGSLWLLFGMIDGDAEIWVDGKSAGKLPADPWDKPKAVEVTSLLSPDRDSRVVVRVKKENFAAGIAGSVKLVQGADSGS